MALRKFYQAAFYQSAHFSVDCRPGSEAKRLYEVGNSYSLAVGFLNREISQDVFAALKVWVLAFSSLISAQVEE